MSSSFVQCPFSIAFLLFFSSGVFAQAKMFCGHDIHMFEMEKKHPGYADAVAKTFAEAKLNLDKRSNGNQVYKIKTVVHVVWKEEEENLPDSIILSQIDLLNKDFRLLNPDKDDLRDMYKERQADAGIEFELVDIVRVNTTSNFTPLLITLPDQVKQSTRGGSDAWDTENYLNIWICKIQLVPFLNAQVLGYAYPPTGLTHWPEGVSAPSPELDGVVVDYRCVGDNNSIPLEVPGLGIVFQNGRTVTHEVGHYLGLRHIWGDGGGIFGGSSCNVDDGVEDTPNQGRGSNYICDKEQNTCTEGNEVNEPDMIENYMDYADLVCQNTFTAGQVDIMRSVLEGPRSGITEATTSLAASKTFDNLSIFPNPAAEYIYISGLREAVEVFISDVQGRNAGYLNADPISENGIISMDIRDLQPGFYFIRVQSGNNVFCEKLIRK
jgi:hypothetical protein